jgi:hypothetical protein
MHGECLFGEAVCRSASQTYPQLLWSQIYRYCLDVITAARYCVPQKPISDSSVVKMEERKNPRTLLPNYKASSN